MNVASYYTGLAARGEPQYYIALVLGSDEDAGMFEEPLTEDAKNLLKIIDKDSFFDQLVNDFSTLAAYTKLTDEQRLALIILDPTRKLIFKKLSESSLSKIELREWLEQELQIEIPDIDLLLVPLIRTNLIKKAVVEGITGDCLFLVRDMLVILAPPEKVMTRILKGEIKGEIGEAARIEIRSFFANYKVSDDAITDVAEILADINNYDIISILRNDVTSKEELAKQTEKSIAEVDRLIRKLKKLGIVEELRDKEGNVACVLKADPQISLFFPEYMVDNVREKWSSGELSKEVAVKYLQLLKEEFLT
jgi:DNA-binding transcriptional ArsR family regulator